MILKSTLCRLALRNEAQHDTDCWASQAQRQPTIYSFVTPFHKERRK